MYIELEIYFVNTPLSIFYVFSMQGFSNKICFPVIIFGSLSKYFGVVLFPLLTFMCLVFRSKLDSHVYFVHYINFALHYLAVVFLYQSFICLFSFSVGFQDYRLGWSRRSPRCWKKWMNGTQGMGHCVFIVVWMVTTVTKARCFWSFDLCNLSNGITQYLTVSGDTLW